MRKIDSFLAIAVLAGMSFGVHAQQQAKSTSSPAESAASVKQSNIVTVDALLKRENAKAMSASEGAGAGVGDEPRRAVVVRSAPAPTPVPSFYVTSIYGFGNKIRADLHVDGQDYERLAEGSKVGSCVVKEIQNRCVALAPNQGGQSRMCPNVCWTGEGPPMKEAPEQMPSGMGVPAGVVGGVMPRPLPSGSVMVPSAMGR